MKTRLAQFLLSYRSTPHATTNVSPSELFLQRKIHTRFDLLKPNTEGKVSDKQMKQKQQHDKYAKPRTFSVGQQVMLKDFRTNSTWLPGSIVQQTGPASYKVEIGDGRILRRHLDHIRDRIHSFSTTESSQDDITNPNDFDDTAAHNDLQDFEVSTPPDESPSTGALTARQYPQRNRNRPDRYGGYTNIWEMWYPYDMELTLR